MLLWLWWWFTHSETLFHYFFIAVIASHAEIPAWLTPMTWIYPNISKSILKAALVSIVRLHLRMKRRHFMVTLATELRFLTCAPVPRGAERKSITREMECCTQTAHSKAKFDLFDLAHGLKVHFNFTFCKCDLDWIISSNLSATHENRYLAPATY